MQQTEGEGERSTAAAAALRSTTIKAGGGTDPRRGGGGGVMNVHWWRAPTSVQPPLPPPETSPVPSPSRLPGVFFFPTRRKVEMAQS